MTQDFVDIRTPETANYFDCVASSWSEHYKNDSRFARRFDQICAMLDRQVFSKRAPGRAIDVGCGSGVFTELIGSKGWDVLGVDQSSQMIDVATNHAAALAKNGMQIAFQTSSVEGLKNLGRKFDLIVSFSVLEYVDNDEEALDILSELLEPNGMLVISVPNRSGMIRKIERTVFTLRNMTGNRLFRGHGEYLNYQKHQYISRAFDKMLERRGFAKRDSQFFTAGVNVPDSMLGFFEKKWWAAMYLGAYQKIK